MIEMQDSTYLVLHVRKAYWKVDRKYDEYHMAFRIAQRAQSIIFFLASGVP